MLKKKSSYVMAILGATGAVGKETLEILDERKFPIAGLRLFASKRSSVKNVNVPSRFDEPIKRPPTNIAVVPALIA